MQNITTRISGIFGILLGTVFIISSSLKAISAASFAIQIGKYGVPFPEFFSPLIIVVEALIGIVLIFGIRQRLAGAISSLLLIVFTVVYTYGLLFCDISDCGCFGGIHFLNSSPLWLFIRNAILLTMAVYICFHPVTVVHTHKNIMLTLIAMIIGGCVIAFFSGYSSRNLYYDKTNEGSKPIAVSESPLNDLIVTHPDSTYLVFAFSYSCPHCLNSIANINEYEKLKVVDKVIGITRKKINHDDFNQWFNPKFTIIEIATEKKMIAKELPTSYYIRNDSIIQIYQGEMPCAFLFDKVIEGI